jgi:phytol kinase
LAAIPTQITIQISLVALWLSLVATVAWWVYRYTPAENEWVRKVVHMGTGNVILLAWWLQIPAWIAIGASGLFSGITLLSYYVPILPGINNVGRKSWGTFFYSLSIGILVAWFWPTPYPQFAVLGVLVMTWGDGLGALIGQRWGRHQYRVWGIQKSGEGSLTMALVTYGISSLVLLSLPLGWVQVAIFAGLIAVIATGFEAFSKLGIDNLTVPIVSAAIGFWLTQTSLL